jgi:MFS family permease
MKQPIRLLNRNFLLLWQGLVVSNLGDQVFLIAMVFWLTETTDSATLVGLLFMMAGLPDVIMGPIGGVIADRFSRKKILVISDTLSGVAMLGLASLMFVLPEATGMIIAAIFAVVIFTAISSSFFEPAISSIIPDLVPEEKIATANSITQSSMQLALFVGQGVGGLLYRILGAPVLFLANGISFLISALSELFIVAPPIQQQPSETPQTRLAAFKHDLAEGLRYVWHNRGLRNFVIISSVSSMFSAPILTLLPFYIEDVLHVTADWYGFILAAFGIGSLIGVLLAGVIPISSRMRAFLILLTMFIEGLLYGVIALVYIPLATIGLSVVVGITTGFAVVNVTTLVQITTPAHMRGRIFGLLGTISGSVAPLASGATGIIADLTGQNIPLIYLVCSVVLMLLTVLAALNGDIRAWLASERSSTEDDISDPPLTIAGELPS